MTPDDISVVIPAVNEAQRVDRAIRSAQKAGAEEIIVCDGGSDDATINVALQNGARICESEPGRGHQLRAGAAQATKPVLLFLHADNALSDGCLQQICVAVNAAADPRLVWGGFRQRIDCARGLYRLLESGNAARIRYRGMPFGDQAMFVSKSIYEQVGGFEAIPLMEDVKLSRALRRIGWPMLLDGPVHVAARRWQQQGVIRQTARNWWIQLAHCAGVKEQCLSDWYHVDQQKKPRSIDRGHDDSDDS
ncbi:MAG: TIGR04283 family arsenosugar biosynthesis glycosyltransferase, partial [Planctomycetota bacterium]